MGERPGAGAAGPEVRRAGDAPGRPEPTTPGAGAAAPTGPTAVSNPVNATAEPIVTPRPMPPIKDPSLTPAYRPRTSAGFNEAVAGPGVCRESASRGSSTTGRPFGPRLSRKSLARESPTTEAPSEVGFGENPPRESRTPRRLRGSIVAKIPRARVADNGGTLGLACREIPSHASRGPDLPARAALNVAGASLVALLVGI